MAEMEKWVGVNIRDFEGDEIEGGVGNDDGNYEGGTLSFLHYGFDDNNENINVTVSTNLEQ
ncbi:hypothetical protein SESBI_13692 [Sesbania bispinosa]|nr:hypothetical protein SESBI_13692 [Sesbania bispinosa]